MIFSKKIDIILAYLIVCLFVFVCGKVLGKAMYYLLN